MKLIWLSSLFTCIRGGNTVCTAAAMMILADATPDVSRTRIFSYTSKFFIAGEMLGPPVGAALMALDPWIPNVLGCLCMGFAAALAFLTPETLRNASRSGSTSNPAALDNAQPLSSLQSLKAVVQHALITLSFTFQDKNLELLVGAYFTVNFARETLGLLVRYVSTRFSIPLAQVWQLSLRLLRIQKPWTGRVVPHYLICAARLLWNSPDPFPSRDLKLEGTIRILVDAGAGVTAMDTLERSWSFIAGEREYLSDSPLGHVSIWGGGDNICYLVCRGSDIHQQRSYPKNARSPRGVGALGGNKATLLHALRTTGTRAVCKPSWSPAVCKPSWSPALTRTLSMSMDGNIYTGQPSGDVFGIMSVTPDV